MPPQPLFLAVGQQGTRLTSPDGITWSPETSGKEGEIYRGCAIGNDNDLNAERARKAKAFFVAPVMYMQIKPGSKSVPAGKIDMFKRFMPKIWTPGGVRLDWDHFVQDHAKTLKFSIS